MKKGQDVFVSAVIVAAGKGSRMNMEMNKQYIEICGVPILARAIEHFQECKLIQEIIVVVNADDIIYCSESIIREFSFTKVKTIVAGGAERQDSVYNGLLEVDKSCEIVLIHDGARPFISDENIRECIRAAGEFGAASLAVPVKDTIKKADKNGFVEETLDRSNLQSIQTPQGFRLETILDAHKIAAEKGIKGTDDAVLAEIAGYKLKLVKGSYYNIKVTTCEDLILATAIAEDLD